MEFSDYRAQYSEEVLEKATKIKLLICDVDGVLSDGKVYFGNDGEELKNFNIKDGLGIKLMQRNGIKVAIITGRQSNIVDHRASELGIELVYQGRSDKRATFDEIARKLNLNHDEIAHVGDDLPDLPLMQKSGLGICVADAYHFLKERADWITKHNGGQGAVRDISDLLLTAQNKIELVLESYLK